MRCALLLLLLVYLSADGSRAQGGVLVEVAANSALPNRALQEQIEANASALLSAFNAAYESGRPLQLPSEAVTASGQRFAELLWRSSPFFCPEAFLTRPLDALRTGSPGYSMRQVPLVTQARKPDGTLNTEAGVLRFTADGRIDRMDFGLGAEHYTRLEREGTGTYESLDRKEILKFIDAFRTAYNTKDLSYINRVFSEHALIIVGHVVEEAPERDGEAGLNLERSKVEFIRRDKSQYLEKLKQAFDANEFIHVTFDKLNIDRHDDYERYYGVNLVQRWESSTYEDEGYLFLFIDFRDEAHPLIHIRTWQPLSATPPDSAFDLNRVILPPSDSR